MLKKFLSDSKEKHKLEILDNLSILKEKKQGCLQVFYSYHETKLFGVYLIFKMKILIHET
jgi:hypothetical protein